MLPPELIAKLNECARADFVALRDAALFWQVTYSRMVIAGLLFEGPELIHEIASILDKWFPSIIKKVPRFRWVISSERFIESAKIAAFVGWIFIIGGLIGELRASSKIVDFSARIEECSDAKVTKATLEAGDAASSAKIAHEEADSVKGIADEARADAKDALAKAQTAQRELAHAEADAAKAQTVASRALSTADKAESHLADALKQAADATAELNRLKSPRSLVNVPAFVTALEPFKGTEYTFSAVFGDEESVTLLKQIDSALSIAGWKRVKAPGGFPALNVYGRDVDFAVPSTVLTGVRASVDSTKSLTSLQALPVDKLPPLVKTAIALKLALDSSLSPAEVNPKLVDVESGTSTTVRIMVGKKP